MWLAGADSLSSRMSSVWLWPTFPSVLLIHHQQKVPQIRAHALFLRCF